MSNSKLQEWTRRGGLGFPEPVVWLGHMPRTGLRWGMDTPRSMPSTAHDYFGAMVGSYDSFIRRAVPRYDEMIQRLLDYLPPTPGRILELGCGTGNLTLELGRRFPTASITTVDAAPEMTRVTLDRATAAGFAPRLRALTARFEDLDLEAGSFELITSCMSLHHVVDKGALFGAISRWLTPAGTLAFADELLGAGDENQKVHWSKWLEFAGAPGNCNAQEVQELLDHAQRHDHYVSLPEHFDLLRRAGFASVDCVWRSAMYTVVTATRS